MRILIVTNGLYDFFYSLQGELLGLGHDVYMLHLENNYLEDTKNDKKDTLLGEECDLVFTANLFGDKIKKSVLNLVASFNITCPIISVTWGHPVENLKQLWQHYDVDHVNAVIKDLRILFWSPCEKAALEYRRLGFKSIIFAPLGLSSKLHTYPFMQWLKPKQATTNNYMELVKKSSHHVKKNISQAKIIYMGILPKKPEVIDQQVDLLAQNMVEIAIADPTLSRYDMDQLWTFIYSKPPSEQARLFLQVILAYRYYHARGTRRGFVHRLKKEFGKEFLLIGDDWMTDNLDAEPTQSIVARGLLYHHIPVSVDFGSTTFETCFFPRPIEIVRNVGCLLSYRHYDSEYYFKKNADSLVFNDQEEMCEKVDALLSDPAKRDKCSEDLYETFSLNHDMKKSLKLVISQAIKL
ncbi:MAG: glycosyltransferase family 1 protein [Magnetococcales bacterium]|nr:glycosyltransferase family 1 protein [Magnetococcales bacterium]